MPEPDTTALVEEIGTESEEDASTPTDQEISDAYVTGSDWTTETIVNQLRKGNINLDPRFQRREVWTRKRKSLLIESIILNLPVPQIVLAERKDNPNTYVVLDGKQRLLSIRQFCVDQEDERDEGFNVLELSNLGIRGDLNEESYESLSNDPQHASIVNAFDNHTIRTVVIRNWPDNDYLHRVFLRLNTGSVPLSPQELRQALIPGPFTDFIDDFATSSGPLQRALGIDGPDFRMRDNEVLLRSIAFALRANEYPGNLKKFLDETAEMYNQNWTDAEAAVTAEADSINEAIEATIAVFGDRDSFSTHNGEDFEGRFNRAVFDIMVYYFREADYRGGAIDESADVKAAFVELSNSDAEFHQALTTTTKSKQATAKRFVSWASKLTETIGLEVTPPATFVKTLEG
jgi:hypothetical protein